MATEGTWRPHPFVQEKKYRVLKDYVYLRSRFTAGDVLEFDTSGYEHYDNTSLFRFYPVGSYKDPSGGQIWNLHDDEPDEKFAQYFEPL